MKRIFGRLISAIRKNRVVILIVGVYLAVLKLFTNQICPFVILTGFPCPGCGLTRAGILFLKGEFKEAFRMNPVFYPLLAAAVVFCICRYVMGKEVKFLQKYLILIGIFAVGVYIYRMTEYFPDREPMVYNYRSILGKYLFLYLGGS